MRVIGIFAHVDAGKTTTSETILYHTDRIHRLGSVDEGNTQLDWMLQERERGITVTSAATACEWRGHRISLIDTPGHIDFSAEVVRSIRVIDGAVILVCGVGGVEPQTGAVWMHADREGLSRVLFVNKLDRTGADFRRVLADIRDKLTPRAMPLQLPVGREGDFRGVVDLLTERALLWDDGAERFVEAPVPAEMAEDVAQAREALLDAICETDDVLLELRLHGHEPDVETLKAALRYATLAGKLVPVLCGSARARMGVEQLLDAVVDYLPAPSDMPVVRGHSPAAAEVLTGRPDDPDMPLCATAFKIVTDPYVGHLTWVRVFSGSVRSGDVVYNPRAETRERVGRIYRIHGSEREQVDGMGPADVVALVGLKSAVTGDTLCHPDCPVQLDSLQFPDPVIMVALRPSSKEESGRLHEAVLRLCREDPTLVARFDPETEEETLAGMGELHLDITLDRLRTEFGCTPEVSPPQVAYRETVRDLGEATAVYRKQTGGHGHFAEVQLRVEPLKRGQGVVVVNEAPGDEIPADFVRPIEVALRRRLEEGIIAGYPVTDLRVTLLRGKFHEVDSSAGDFQVAACMAVQQAVRRARPGLLEPIMGLDVNLSEEHLGAVTADLGRRRGSVNSLDVRANMRHLSGEVPLAEVRGYATELRSLTSGKCSFTLEFRRHDFVPESLAEEIISQREADGKVPGR